MEMPVMEELATRTNGALGAVWIKSSSSSLRSVGLESALKAVHEARVKIVPRV